MLAHNIIFFDAPENNKMYIHILTRVSDPILPNFNFLLVFSMVVALLDIGLPQYGQANAFFDISFLQSGQVTNFIFSISLPFLLTA